MASSSYCFISTPPLPPPLLYLSTDVDCLVDSTLPIERMSILLFLSLRLLFLLAPG